MKVWVAVTLVSLVYEACYLIHCIVSGQRSAAAGSAALTLLCALICVSFICSAARG